MQAQEILSESVNGKEALAPMALLDLSLQQACDNSRKYDDRVSAGVVGLAISEVLGIDRESAASIWSQVVNCEIDLWRRISSMQENMKAAMVSNTYIVHMF